MRTNVISPATRRTFYWTLLSAAILILAYAAIATSFHELRYFWDYPAWQKIHPVLLLTHIGAGFIALMVGPWQFWKGLRDKYRNFHRWTGRVYLGTVAISSLIGLYMGLTTTHGLVFGTGIVGLALAWIITGTFAYLSIRKGLVNEHRYWMICNYVVTFGFVTYRLGNDYLLSVGVEYAPRTVMAWLCWVPQLSLTFLILYVRESRLFAKSKRRILAEEPVEA